MTDQRSFTCHVFIGTSLDGFIARTNGDLEWLTSRGEAAGEYGFQEFIDRIDTVAAGRVTYGNWLSLGAGQWPFHGKHVAVLSTRLDAANDPRIAVYRNLDQLLKRLVDRGALSSAYRLAKDWKVAQLLVWLSTSAPGRHRY
jgi:dihydrofolate reductase